MFVVANNFDVAPYAIPNLDKVINTFTEFADTEEREALLKLLGRQLYTAFVNGLAALPSAYDVEADTEVDTNYVYGNDIWKALTVTTGVTPTAGGDWELVEEGNKWLELKNGADYEYQDLTYTWGGMVKLLKPYIYQRWLAEDVRKFSGNATVAEVNENSEMVSPNALICRAYNDYAYQSGVSKGCDYGYNFEDTLFGFLYVDSVLDVPVYSNWVYTYPYTKNEFDF